MFRPLFVIRLIIFSPHRGQVGVLKSPVVAILNI